jgi:DNA-directed RNA polymerase specialized sigma24 family protein
MTPQELETILLRRQAERDWKEHASAAEIEEYERWKAELAADYKRELERDRKRRSEHQDGMDITELDRNNDDISLNTSKALRITSDLDYLDIIFTQRPEDLHEVVTDEALIAAIKKLTRCQKEAMFLRMQPHTKTKQAAEDLGSSPRNIRKHLAKAREIIFEEIGEPQ